MMLVVDLFTLTCGPKPGPTQVSILPFYSQDLINQACLDSFTSVFPLARISTQWQSIYDRAKFIVSLIPGTENINDVKY